MTFHVVSLPHTVTSKEYLMCAYTQKVLNFCRMMKSLGHTVYHYGGEGSTPECSEHINIITKEQRQQWWGTNDWHKDFFAIDWNSSLPYWVASNQGAIEAIRTRINPHDFICLIGGNCQKPIADAFPAHSAVEFGVGYEGVFSRFRVFESYAWMHHVYGLINQKNGQNYDCVIPNYFDSKDFPLVEKKGDYFLFIGRVVQRKGIQVAMEICKRLGTKLKVVGQGVISHAPGEIVSKEVTLKDPCLEYVGTISDVQERGQLMGNAQAVICPTIYIGPFEGVSVEAMLCGTPVICSDWGAFAENVVDGVTGYRVRSLGEALWAARSVYKLNPKAIREYAVRRFDLNAVRYRYQDYFRQLLTLWGKGWYDESYEPADKRMLGNFQ